LNKTTITLGLLVIFVLGFSKTTFAASDFYKPGVLPNSPWYQVKTIKEKLELFFTLSAEKKVETLSIQAGRRLAEARFLIGVDPAKVQTGLTAYLETYTKAFAEANKIKTLSGQQTAFENLANNTGEELKTLESVYTEAQDETTKSALTNLISTVSKNQTDLIKSVAVEVKGGIVKKIEDGRVAGIKTLVPSKILGN